VSTRALEAPWSEYAAGTDLEDFEEFCAEHLTHFIDEWDGLPVELEPFQQRFFGEALAYDEGGRQCWDFVTLIMPRKGGKTTMLAAYAVWRLLAVGGSPEISLSATSDKQADLLFQNCAKFIRRSPALSGLARVRDHQGEIVREDGMGRIIRMSSDPARLQGYNPSLVICDEVGEWNTPNLKRAYAALTTGGGARRPQVFTITTAGAAAERTDGILGGILDSALENGKLEREPGLTVARMLETKSLVWNYEAPTSDPLDVKAMKLANPASWISEEFLYGQAAGGHLKPSEVLRYHGCVWAARETAWLDPEAWAACADEKREVRPRQDIVVAFDGSYSRDATVLMGCTTGERPHLFVVRCWERPAEERDRWVVPRGEVHAAIERAFQEFNVRELVCDRAKWFDEFEEWAARYGEPPVIEFRQTRSAMTEACSVMYGEVVRGGLSHDGDDRLARHLANAVVRETADGVYITKEARDSPRKIDLAVAAVMAFRRAVDPSLSGGKRAPMFAVIE